MRRKAQLITAGATVVCISAGQVRAAEPKLRTEQASSAKETQAKETQAKGTRAKAAPVESPEAKTVAGPLSPVISGKVLETMDDGGFTYLLLEKDGTKKWVTVPAAKVSVGQVLAAEPEPRTAQASPAKETQAKETQAKAPAESSEAKTAAVPLSPGISGKVVETMDAGEYTYLLLEKDGTKKWVAVPAAKVSVGQELRVKPGIEMGLFSSKSLGRSFDNILFSPGLVAADTAAQAAQPQMPLGEKKGMPKGMSAMSGAKSGGEEPKTLAGVVVETVDSGGYTYICLKQGEAKTWAAVPTVKVAVGDKVELQPGNVMTNFTSKTLKRTFERVVFSGGLIQKK